MRGAPRSCSQPTLCSISLRWNWNGLCGPILLTSTSQNVATVTLGIIISPQISSSAFGSLSPSVCLFLPSSKPFHSCRELVLHKLPSGILNQSPATKGESVWLITERCAQHACRQTHREEEGEEPLSEGLTPLQTTWEEEGEEGDQAIWGWLVKAVLATLATHYLLIT